MREVCDEVAGKAHKEDECQGLEQCGGDSEMAASWHLPWTASAAQPNWLCSVCIQVHGADQRNGVSEECLVWPCHPTCESLNIVQYNIYNPIPAMLIDQRLQCSLINASASSICRVRASHSICNNKLFRARVCAVVWQTSYFVLCSLLACAMQQGARPPMAESISEDGALPIVSRGQSASKFCRSSPVRLHFYNHLKRQSILFAQCSLWTDW